MIRNKVFHAFEPQSDVAVLMLDRVFTVTDGSRPGIRAIYPGTFDPVTPGHLDIIERARILFARITVLVAVNPDKQPSGTPSERAILMRRELPPDWDNVSVAAWAGLTIEYCRRHGASVIVRGVRNPSDRIAAFMDSETVVDGVPLRVVELTGEPGDMVFCHPVMVHCGAANRGAWPRFMRIKQQFLTPEGRVPLRGLQAR